MTKHTHTHTYSTYIDQNIEPQYKNHNFKSAYKPLIMNTYINF